MTHKQHTLRACALALGLAGACAIALAKLPPPTPEAAAQAAETAARQAWAGKVDQYKLCLAQDRVAAHYRAARPDAPPSAVPPGACPDPGPFAYTPPENKPLEASGAHSPPGTAGSPPSTPVPDAATSPAAAVPAAPAASGAAKP